MKSIAAYKTIDGRIFASMEEAHAHETVGILNERIAEFLALFPSTTDEQKITILEWEKFRSSKIESRFIEELELTVRTENVLKAAEICTIASLIKYSYEELLNTPGMGRKSLGEIVEKLQLQGLTLLGDAR